ncbi:MAG: hypothetical protein NT007_07925 [Candidatus Kapabacteria bacterium]|nr:hypothetical protein [Candidatus Kapabacteria bacterium]
MKKIVKKAKKEIVKPNNSAKIIRDIERHIQTGNELLESKANIKEEFIIWEQKLYSFFQKEDPEIFKNNFEVNVSDMSRVQTGYNGYTETLGNQETDFKFETEGYLCLLKRKLEELQEENI